MSEFLKCDAPGCDHCETVAEITAEMVGRPCPKCGANLLTRADWDFYRSVMRPSIDALEGLLGTKVRADECSHPEMKVAVNYHDGEIRIRLPLATPPVQE